MTSSGATLILITVAAACIFVILGIPRPISPTQLPAVVIHRHMESRARKADERMARQTPQSAAIHTLRSLIFETSLAETQKERFGTAQRRQHAMNQAVRNVLEKHGVYGLRTLRSRFVRSALHSIEENLTSTQAMRVLGRFRESLDRYHAFDQGNRIAPYYVIRLLYFARWNAIVGRLSTDGFSNDELRAYWGWLALHAKDAPIETRLRALRHYGDLGGKNAAEAAGILFFQDQKFYEATQAFSAVTRKSNSIRSRNYGLGSSQLH